MEDMMANEKQYTLSEEQFTKLLETLANKGPQPGAGAPMSPDQQVSAFVDLMKKGQAGERQPHKIDEVACISMETAATFTAVIATSSTFPLGRVVTLKDYQYPAGSDVPTEEGGLVPSGMSMKKKDGQETKEYRHWKWQFYKTDLMRYVGKDAAWLKRMATLAEAEKAPAPTPALEKTGT